MYCYLAVATPKCGVDRSCSDDSDVLMILPLRCLSLFNNTLIVLLVVIGTLCQYGPFLCLFFLHKMVEWWKKKKTESDQFYL